MSGAVVGWGGEGPAVQHTLKMVSISSSLVGIGADLGTPPARRSCCQGYRQRAVVAGAVDCGEVAAYWAGAECGV